MTSQMTGSFRTYLLNPLILPGQANCPTVYISKPIMLFPALLFSAILFAQKVQFSNYKPGTKTTQGAAKPVYPATSRKVKPGQAVKKIIPADIVPLNIGDKVPDIEIDNIINYSRSKIRLSDFRDKLIILDFWGTTCASCIAALPGLDSLQKKFKGKIQVITVTKLDTKDKVISTLQRIHKANKMQLPIVVADDILYKYFPYQLVSHTVWIDKSRKLKAITGIEYVTDKNIQTMLSGKEINWAVKKDVPEYDYEKPLLDMPQKQIVKPAFLYYSAFTGHLDGIAPPNGRKVDAANNTVTVSFYNMGLLALTKIALDYRTGANLKEFVLEVKDSSRIIMPEGEYTSEWNKKNRYCYSITLPGHTSEKETVEIVKRDLIHWLSVIGYTVKKEVRKVNCLALVSIGNNESLYSKGGEYLNELDNADSVKRLINAPLSTFVGVLNKRLFASQVINETGIADNTSINLQLRLISFEDIQELRYSLNEYGLDIVPREKENEMYIITENVVKG